MNTDQYDQVLYLSPQAKRKAFDLVQQKLLKGSNCTSMNVRYDFIEWWFNDGSYVEIEILRDFNDNMEPYAVQVMDFVPHTDQRGTSFYKLVSHDEYDVK